MPNTKWEKFFRKQGFARVAGVDEAGRGPLAGPVTAAAVILPEIFRLKGLNDSKKLSAKNRERLFKQIKKQALAIGVGIVDAGVIDRINIAQAALSAMQLAVENLAPAAEVALMDGKCKMNIPLPQKCIVHGDALCSSIAAASVIAKVVRDRIMDEYAKALPQYSFGNHRGYGTKKHLLEIEKHGFSVIHRRSFMLHKEPAATVANTHLF